jgi:hypothetical protein
VDALWVSYDKAGGVDVAARVDVVEGVVPNKSYKEKDEERRRLCEREQ